MVCTREVCGKHVGTNNGRAVWFGDVGMGRWLAGDVAPLEPKVQIPKPLSGVEPKVPIIRSETSSS